MSDISPVISFLIQSVVITLPGLFTPGPVTAITVERGTVSPHAGAFVTMGHGVVELPFVIFLFAGLGRFTGYSSVRVLVVNCREYVNLSRYRAWCGCKCAFLYFSYIS
jgi:hypothetical protein